MTSRLGATVGELVVSSRTTIPARTATRRKRRRSRGAYKSSHFRYATQLRIHCTRSPEWWSASSKLEFGHGRLHRFRGFRRSFFSDMTTNTLIQTPPHWGCHQLIDQKYFSRRLKYFNHTTSYCLPASCSSRIDFDLQALIHLNSGARATIVLSGCQPHCLSVPRLASTSIIKS